MATELHCSFCRKSEHQVEKLVAGPGVYICDACIGIASRIIADDGTPPPEAPVWRRVVAAVRKAIHGIRTRALLEPGAG